MTPPSSPRLPSLNKDSPIHTPPLISDLEDDRVSSDHVTVAGGEHTNSPTPSTPADFAPSLNDLNFYEYLHRSHPGYQASATSFQPGQWRNWSWSQLEQPKFPVGDDDNYDDKIWIKSL